MFDIFNGTSASSVDVLNAMNTAISDQASYNIVAINLSLGDGTSNSTPCTTSIFSAAVSSASNAGITTVAAAGNSGSKSGLGNPACTPGVVSVGAVYDAAYGTVGWVAAADTNGQCTDTSAADHVTCFSQSAGYLAMLAPGTFVNAPNPSFQESGTSQATPHISGAVYDSASVSSDQFNTAAAGQQTLAIGVPPGNVSDGPLPPWAYALLAILMWFIARRQIEHAAMRLRQ